MSGGIVEYTRDALEEIDELFLWISVDTGPNAAEAFVKRLEKTTQNLAAFPKLGRVRAEVPGGLRSFAVHPWVLFYEPLEGRRGIRLLRVVDGRRNLAELFGSDDQ